MNQKEYNNKAVNGPSCSYASLIDYSSRYQPGSQIQTSAPGKFSSNQNVQSARDENGRPIYDSAGNLILVSPDQKVIRTPVSQACGNFASISLAYGM